MRCWTYSFRPRRKSPASSIAAWTSGSSPLNTLMALPDCEVVVVDYDCPDRSGDWVREAFVQLGLDLKRQVRIDPSRLHGGDRQHTFGNIELAKKRLGWQPKTELAEMVRALIEAERRAMTTEEK